MALLQRTRITQPPRPEHREFQEAIRDALAAASLGDLAQRRGSVVIGVTSPSHGEGKTTLAMAMAGLLASDLGVDVVLMDTDFETHSLGVEYDLAGEGGLAEVLDGRLSLESVVTRIPNTRLYVVASGSMPADVGRLARSGDLVNLVDRLKKQYRYVVLDLPGMLNSSAGRTVAPLCDGVIVVTQSGKTSSGDLERTLERLEGVRVLGVVVNRWKSHVPRWLERALGIAS